AHAQVLQFGGNRATDRGHGARVVSLADAELLTILELVDEVGFADARSRTPTPSVVVESRRWVRGGSGRTMVRIVAERPVIEDLRGSCALLSIRMQCELDGLVTLVLEWIAEDARNEDLLFVAALQIFDLLSYAVVVGERIARRRLGCVIRD